MEERERRSAPQGVALSRIRLHGLRLHGLRLHGLRLHGLLRQLLDDGMAVELHVTGESMSPLIRSGDLLTLTPAGSRRPRRGDVVAFLAGGRSLVIHRIVGLDEEWVYTRGDALRRGDQPVPVAEVLAAVTGIVRRGRAVRFGLGRERVLVAALSRRGWLTPVLAPWRWLARTWS